MNENYWKEPHEFRPERFIIDEEGKIIQTPHFIPFGSGR